jgi:hypothetical protein
MRQVDLGDLDPTSLELHASEHDAIGPNSLVVVNTTDNVPAVRVNMYDRSWEHPIETVSSTPLGSPVGNLRRSDPDASLQLESI